MKKHYTIPFFIPHKGCAFNCIFCGQKKISGKEKSPSTKEISSTIKRYLKTIPKKGVKKEVAFFGGSFTGIPRKKQETYLKTVMPFIKKGVISGVRISTRPDFIDQKTLGLLKKYKVKTIELGVQSMFDDVLFKAGRGHTSKDVVDASLLILNNNFKLGHQIMVGLPGSTLEKELETARMSISMKVSEVRIYPLIVIKKTKLASIWKKGFYKPLTEKEAVKRCTELAKLFKKNKVFILRCGLHPSPGLLSRKDILAGPFHEAFGQKVESNIYKEALEKFLKTEKKPEFIKHMFYNPEDASYVVGFKRENASHVESIVKSRKTFVASEDVLSGKIEVEYKNGQRKSLVSSC